jgi:signal transduction histidine kinase
MKWCRYIATVLSAVFFFLHGFGQGEQVRIDSLYVVLASASPNDKPRVFLELLFELQRVDKDSALKEAQRGIEAADAMDDFVVLAGLYDIMGRIWYSRGQLQLAIRMFSKGVEVAKKTKNPETIGHLANSLGTLHLRQKNFPLAKKYLTESREAFSEAELGFLVAHVNVNLGNLYSQQEDADKALTYLNEALNIATIADDPVLKSKALNNIGEIYAQEKQYEKAEQYFLSSIEVKESVQLEEELFSSLINLAELNLERKNFEESKKYLDLAYFNADKDPRKSNMISIFLAYGQYEEEIGDVDDAIYYYQNGLRIADSLGDVLNRIELNKRLALLSEKAGRFQAASGYHREASQLMEQEAERIKSLHREEIEGLNQFNLQETSLKLYKAEQKKVRIQMYSLIGGLALAILLLLSLFSRYRSRLKTQAILEARNKEVQLANQLLEVRNQEVAEKNNQLEQSNKELTEFAYAASHDLKEPLRTIKSYLQLFLRREGPTLKKESGEFIEYALDASIRLDYLLHSLLQYSRVGRVETAMTPVDLNEVMDTVRMDLRKNIQDQQAEITFESLPVVRGYATELYQLFLNLVSNALKFARNNVPPVVTVSAKLTDDYLLLAVKDNGIGIETRFFERIFGMFHRLNAPGAYEGGGIGLATCKKIAEHHNGSIWVESQVGEGSTFFVQLPASLVEKKA